MAITWDFSPTLFTIGSIEIRWYGLLFSIAFYTSYALMKYMLKLENKPTNKLDSLSIYLIMGTVIGARLGHCFFYEPQYYLQNPLEILAIWKGGLASHGGMLGVLIATFFFVKRNNEYGYVGTLDKLSVISASSAVLIRIGNLFNSEIYGKPTGSDFGVIFTAVDDLPRHPTQIYEAFCYLVIFITLLILTKRKTFTQPGKYLGLFLVSTFSARFFIEYFKVNQSLFENGMMLNMGQILSIVPILVGCYFLVRK